MTIYTTTDLENETDGITADWINDPNAWLDAYCLVHDRTEGASTHAPEEMREEALQFAEAYAKLLQARMGDDPAKLKDIWGEALDDVTDALSGNHSKPYEQDISALAVDIVTQCWGSGRMLKYAIMPELRLRDMGRESSGGRVN